MNYNTMLLSLDVVAAEEINSVTVTSAARGLLEEYVTPVGFPGTTLIPAGIWEFNIYADTSSTAGGSVSTVEVDVFKRTSGGVETLLFTAATLELTTTAGQLYVRNIAQGDFLLTATDRLVFKVYGRTTSGTQTIRFYHNGTTRYSHIHTPISSQSQGIEFVLENRTYYVSTTGSDSNTGLIDGAPFLTIAKAAEVISRLYVPLNVTVTIQLADGTYSQAAALALPPIQGGGYGYLKGNAATPANVTISSGAAVGSLVNVRGPASTWFVQDLSLTSAHGASLIRASFGGTCFYSNVRFGSTTLWHLRADFGGTIFATGNYAITGAAAVHAFCEGTGSVLSISSATITISGTPAWSTAFTQVAGGGSVRAVSTVFSGGATGKRYDAYLNGVINTNGGGANFFPGNAAGTTATGGQYA